VNLRVVVNDELVLDAGTTEELSGSELVVHPPKETLFRQVLDYLRAKPDPPSLPKGSTVENEGAAAAAVILRWGSYLAVLADRAKPVWAEARSPTASRICDSEMARINIEASAALAEWIDISREDRSSYENLVGRVLAYLPFPKTRPRPLGSEFVTLAMPEFAAKIAEATDAVPLARVRADAEVHPSRLFANALVNTTWRNGPVEDIHAGDFRGYPLDHRRVTVAEEHTLMAFTVDRLTTGMACATTWRLNDPIGRGRTRFSPMDSPGRCSSHRRAGRSRKRRRRFACASADGSCQGGALARPTGA
jgi:hypothetical protein